MPGKRAKQTVCFTTKGQIVIPAALRKYFQIENGSEAIVEETADGILLRPITAWSKKRAREVGKKGTASGSDFAAEWAKHKAEERAPEEKRKHASAHAILDSYALISYLRDEAGANPIEQQLQDAASGRCTLWKTEVNYAEVHDMLLRKEGASIWDACEKAIAGLPIRFVSTDRLLANTAAGFKIDHQLSLADAFANALTKALSATLIPGDPEFAPLTDAISIDWLT